MNGAHPSPWSDRWVRLAGAALAVALTFPSPPAIGRASAAGAPAAAAPAADAGVVAPATAYAPGTVVTLQGTPHAWVADRQGVLHWVGDPNAIAKHLAEERDAAAIASGRLDESDYVFKAIEHLFDVTPELTLEQLRAAQRGDPWMTYAPVRLNGAVYIVRREPWRRGPALLHVQTPEDLALFAGSVAPDDLVLEPEVWERRYGIKLNAVPRSELRAALAPRATPAPCTATADVLDTIRLQSTAAVQAVVRNTCPTTLRIGVSAVVYDEVGRPVATTEPQSWDAPPGDARTPVLAAELSEGAPASGLWASPLVASSPTGSAAPPICVDVGAARCLEMDAWLLQTVRVLQGLEQGNALVQDAANFGVALRYGGLGPRMLGVYEPMTRTITITNALDDFGEWERVTVVAHELQHASDHAHGLLAHSAGDACAGEAHAFRRESSVWVELWDGTLPEPRNSLQKDLNTVTGEVLENPDPDALPDTLLSHHYECATEREADRLTFARHLTIPKA